MTSLRRTSSRVFLAADDLVIAGICRKLEHDGHRVQCVSNADDTVRALSAMYAGTTQVPDMMVLHTRLLTDRAHAALRSLRARNRSSVLLLIVHDHDAAMRRLAGWLGASLVFEPPTTEDVELIAEWAARPRAFAAGPA